MAKIYCKSSYLLRKDTAENWENKNPILRKGEQGLETDTGIMKIGDGVTTFNSLSDDNIYLPKSRINKSVDDVKSYVNNNFANALKGSASGEAVRLNDVSPIEHEIKIKLTAESNYSDFSGVTLKRYGKNLFDTVNAVKLNGRSSFSVTNNKIMASQSTTQSYQSANVLIPQSLIGKNITLSAKSNTSGANVAALRIQWVSNSGLAAGNMILGTPDSAGNIVVTGTVPTQPDETHNNLCLMFYSNSTGTLETGTTYTATYSDIQIELGSTVTEYEPYKTATEYTPAADGTVSGVTSISDDITLITDTDGVIINAEYNRDINKAFAELQQAVLSMGGNT